MSIVVLFFMVIGLIGFRYVFIRFNKGLWNYFSGGPYGDAATYFFLIQFFRKNSCGVSDERCMLSNDAVLVPSAYMKIVGKLFGDTILLKKSWLPNFILYSLAVSFFLALLYINKFSMSLWVYMALLFILQPDNINLDKHRVHYTVLQPRYFGLLLNSALWFFYVMYGITWFSSAAILLLTVLSINTSVFCRQATVFSILLASIFLLDPFLFLMLPAAMMVSAVLFPKEFIPSIMPQLRYSYQYYLNYYKPRPTSNPVMNFLKNIMARAMYESYPYFASVLVMVLAFYQWNSPSSQFNFGNDTLHRLVFSYLSFFLIFIITGIRKFAFLGECWRYFSYNTYYMTPVFLPVLVSLLPVSETVKSIILVGTIIIYIAFAFFGAKDSLDNKNPALISLLQQGGDAFKDSIWYGIPYRASTTAVALGYGKKTFEYQYGNHSQEIHEKYFAFYPYLKWNGEMLQHHKITHILVEKELEESAFLYSNFSTDGLTLLASNQAYSIYKV